MVAPEFVKIRSFFEMETFFFLVFTPEFIEIFNEDLCFFIHTLEFQALKFLCPPKISLCPPSHAILALGLVLYLIIITHIYFHLIPYSHKHGHVLVLATQKMFMSVYSDLLLYGPKWF